jgi:hypothetical protein
MTRTAVVSVVLVAAGYSPAIAERLALVVGNAAYTTVPALKNAGNDAEDVAAALTRLGFEVTLLRDLGGTDLWAAVDDFAARSENAEATVFYYSGHAFQMSGVNYLLPVDAKLTGREDVQAQTWNLDGVIARLQDRQRQTLIFLDACRNDPLPADVLGSGAADGLARVQTGVGTFVAFATEPGGVTFDGAPDARNSPFTTALLKHLETPGQSISDLMINVRNEVGLATGGLQSPWDQSSLRDQFYFVPETEQKQELTEADYELLAQLSFEDRQKFMELLRASGFSEESLQEAEAAIFIAQENLQVAAEAEVTLVAAPATDAVPLVEEAGGDLASLEVETGDTVVAAPGELEVASLEPAPETPAVAEPEVTEAPATETVPETPEVAAADAVETAPEAAGIGVAEAPATETLPETPEVAEATETQPEAAESAGLEVAESPATETVPETPEVAVAEVTETAPEAAEPAATDVAEAPAGETLPEVAEAPATETAPETPEVAVAEALETAPEAAEIEVAEAPATETAEPATDLASAANGTPGLPTAPAVEEPELPAPVVLAALDWQTRGVTELFAVREERAVVPGTQLTADTAEGREVLAAIDPALLEDLGILPDTADISREVQAELKRLGCYRMTVDGAWGRGSRTALTSYFLAKKKVPDTLEPTAELLASLRAETKVVCEVQVARATVVPGKTKAILPTKASADVVVKNPGAGRTAKTKEETKKGLKAGMLNPGSF